MSQFNDPFGVFSPTTVRYDTPKAPTEKQRQAALEQQIAEQNALESQRIVSGIRQNPDWSDGSLQQRQKYLRNWEQEVWPQYGRELFGDNVTSQEALLYRNSITRPLRQDIQDKREEIGGFANTGLNLLQSAGRGLDMAYDALRYGVPAGASAIQDRYYSDQLQQWERYRDEVVSSADLFTPEEYDAVITEAEDAIAGIEENRLNNYENWRQSLTTAANAIAQSELNEEARRAANPRRANSALRDEELSGDPDSIVLWERIKEGGPGGGVEAILNAAFEQLPNAGAIIGSALAGSVVGGPGGAVAGAAASGAAVTAGQNTTEIIESIVNAPDEVLRNVPRYAELQAQGLSEDEIRQTIARDAVAEVYVITALIGAASGVLGPEALIARSSILGPLLAGGLPRRILTGAGLGFFEEGVTEGAEQVAQNYSWNYATGDDRPLTEGVAQAAVTGGIVGGVFGGAGGVANSSHQNTATRAGITTGTGAASVGGFNTLQGNQSGRTVPLGANNPTLSDAAALRSKEATASIQQADALITDVVSSQRIPTTNDVAGLFVNLRAAELRGTPRENIDAMLVSFQTRANIPADNNLNVTQLYDAWVARTGVTTPRQQTPLPVQQRKIEFTARQNEIATQLRQLEREGRAESQDYVVLSQEFSDIVEQQRTATESTFNITNLPIDPSISETQNPESRAIMSAMVSFGISNEQSVVADFNRMNNPDLSRNDLIYSIFGQHMTIPTIERVRSYVNEQLRQTSQTGADGSDTTGAGASSQPTADTTVNGAASVSGSDAANTGTGGTTQGTGTSGTAEQNTGTPAGTVQTGESVGGQTGDGTDSGRNIGILSSSFQGRDQGQRSSVATAEQRAVDAGQRTETGRSEEAGSAVAADAEIEAIVNNIRQDAIDAGILFDDNMTNWAYEQARTLVALGNMPVSEAYAATESSLQSKVNDQVAATVDAVQQNPTDIYLAAIDEAIQSDENMATALAVFGTLTAEQEIMIHAGLLPADVAFNTDPTRNGTMDDSISLTVGRGTNANPAPQAPTAAESAARTQALTEQTNEILAEGQQPATTTTVDNTNGTSTIAPVAPIPAGLTSQLETVAEAILERSRLRSEAAELGRARIQHLRQKFLSTAYGATYTAGRWHKLATNIRGSWVDSESHLRSWLIRSLPAVDGNFDSSPVVGALQTTRNRVTAATNVLIEQALEPVASYVQQTARAMNVDPEVVQVDFGMMATALHTIEAEPVFRMRLEEELQRAYAMPDGPAKKTAVENATETLRKYDEYQANPDAEKAPTYGGRRRADCEQIVQELIAKYGEETILTARQLIGDGFDTVTNFLLANGQLDLETVESWHPWQYFVSLTTEKQTAEGAVNDINHFMPRANFHRNGTTTEAQNAYNSLAQFIQRAAMNVGQSEFANYMNQTYTTLEQRGDTNGLKRFSMAQLYARLDNAVDENGRVDRNEYAAADSAIKNMDMIIRVLERADDGTEKVVTYGFMFDAEHTKESASMRSPFKSATLHPLLNSAANVTRSFASLSTKFKAFFPPLTAARDTIERVTLLPTKSYRTESGGRISGTQVAAKMVAFLANPTNLINAAAYQIRGQSFSPAFDAYMNEFQNSGAKYTYNNLLRNNNTKLRELLKGNLNPAVYRGGAATVNVVTNVISGWGDLFYAAPGFAQYTVLRKSGVDISDSARGVIELMNMQQNGTLSYKLSAIYPFTNSIGQTASNLLGAFGLHVGTFDGANPNVLRNALRGQAMFIGTMAAVRTLIPALTAGLGDDPDTGLPRIDRIPLVQLGTFLPVPIGEDGDFFKVPTGFGITQLAAIAAYGIDRVERGQMSHGDLTATLLSSFAKNLVPNSAPAFEFSRDPIAYMFHTFSPMLAQPVTQLVTNRTYSGARIVQESYNPTLRRSDNANLTTADVWRNLAKNMFSVTDGWLDFSPEQIRTFVNGYMGGVLQGIPAWLEADALYKDETYQSTRDELGPFWTALGASSFYNTKMNISQRAFYDAKDYYDSRVRAAGVGGELTKGQRGQEEQHRRNVLGAIGWTPAEIEDFITIWRTDTALSKINQDFRKSLDGLYGPGMDEELIRSLYGAWSDNRYARQTEAINGLNIYSSGAGRNFGIPDKEAADVLRGAGTGTPVQAGNIDLYSRPIVHNPDGTISTVATISFQTDDGLETVIPTVHPDGYIMSDEEAIQYYFRTGQHFGKYRSVRDAEAAAQRLHEDQARLYAN